MRDKEEMMRQSKMKKSREMRINEDNDEDDDEDNYEDGDADGDEDEEIVG